MGRSTRRFRHFPLIFIDPKRAWGNPTLGKTRLPIFKIWEMVNDNAMDELLEEEDALTLGEINAVMQFVDWCFELGLMEERNGRITYDKDALYRAAELEIPPKGRLCHYCTGFIPNASPAGTPMRERQAGSEKATEGVAHASCLEASMLGEPTPQANVLI